MHITGIQYCRIIIVRSILDGMYHASGVEALHGSHMFCLSSHVIHNLNWKYTLLKFHILQIF